MVVSWLVNVSVGWRGRQWVWSMPYKELFPIFVSAAIWGSNWSGKRIVVFCDNDSTVIFLNKGYTNKEPAASLLRELMLLSMQNNFILRAKHIPGVLNHYTDSI